MYIYGFSDCVGSGRPVYSRLWYLDTKMSYVKGFAQFFMDNTMNVWLVHGSHPNVIGREPRDLGRLKVKVRVMPQGGGETLEIGEKTWRSNETDIEDKDDGWLGVRGKPINNFPCHDLTQRNLVVKNKVLLRFDINCL